MGGNASLNGVLLMKVQERRDHYAERRTQMELRSMYALQSLALLHIDLSTAVTEDESDATHAMLEMANSNYDEAQALLVRYEEALEKLDSFIQSAQLDTDPDLFRVAVRTVCIECIR